MSQNNSYFWINSSWYSLAKACKDIHLDTRKPRTKVIIMKDARVKREKGRKKLGSSPRKTSVNPRRKTNK